MSAMNPAPSRATLVLVIGLTSPPDRSTPGSGRSVPWSMVDTCRVCRWAASPCPRPDRNVGDHRALGAVAGDDGRIAALAAFDRGRQAVDAVLALRFVTAVAFHTGLFDDWLDVLLIGQAIFLCRGRQFGGVPFGLLLVLVSAAEGECREAKAGRNQGSHQCLPAVPPVIAI